MFAAVAQLDRVPDSDSGGRGFESRQPYQDPGGRLDRRDFEYAIDTVVMITWARGG